MLGHVVLLWFLSLRWGWAAFCKCCFLCPLSKPWILLSGLLSMVTLLPPACSTHPPPRPAADSEPLYHSQHPPLHFGFPFGSSKDKHTPLSGQIPYLETSQIISLLSWNSTFTRIVPLAFNTHLCSNPD